MGTSLARADDFECLDWNKNVPHILATGSSGGFVTVWDVKTKKESLTLNNLGRKAVSAVAWDPDKVRNIAVDLNMYTDVDLVNSTLGLSLRFLMTQNPSFLYGT